MKEYVRRDSHERFALVSLSLKMLACNLAEVIKPVERMELQAWLKLPRYDESLNNAARPRSGDDANIIR